MHASTQLRGATVRASHKCRYCSSSGGAGCAGTHRCSGKWVRGGEEGGGGGGGGGGEQQAYQKEEEVEECGARREMAEHRRHQEMFAEKKKRRKRLQPTDQLEPKKERWSTTYENLVLIALLVEKEPDGGKGQMARSHLQSSKMLENKKKRVSFFEEDCENS